MSTPLLSEHALLSANLALHPLAEQASDPSGRQYTALSQVTRPSPTIRQALNDLQILYKEHESSFEALLTRNGNNSIHVNNLQKLMIEIVKYMNGLNPPTYMRVS